MGKQGSFLKKKKKNLLKATHTKLSKIQGQDTWLQNLFSPIQNAAFDLWYLLRYNPPTHPKKKDYHSILISFKDPF